MRNIYVASSKNPLPNPDPVVRVACAAMKQSITPQIALVSQSTAGRRLFALGIIFIIAVATRTRTRTRTHTHTHIRTQSQSQ